MDRTVHHGLEGVLAGESAICEVDHEIGGLRYYGYEIEDLAEHCSFEEVAYLLLMGALPNPDELFEFKEALVASRPVSQKTIDFLCQVSPSVKRMDVLRTAVSMLGMDESDHEANGHAANLSKAIRLTAQMPALLAALLDLPLDENVRTDPSLSHAAYLLTALTGVRPEPFAVKVINVSLILYAEHEFNASTFAARVTASSLSDLHSAITSAIGTLKGPLHGGANEAVMEMLLKIEAHGDVKQYLEERLARRKRIMGFGHRVLRKGDPRSNIIKAYAKKLGEQTGDERWYKVSTALEALMQHEKGLYPNLDFYSASAYYLLGLPIPIYTPLFVCSRITGWAAHIIEQHDHNRLIRPRCAYTGPKARAFVSLEERA